jgi:hypothetical protein
VREEPRGVGAGTTAAASGDARTWEDFEFELEGADVCVEEILHVEDALVELIDDERDADADEFDRDFDDELIDEFEWRIEQQRDQWPEGRT